MRLLRSVSKLGRPSEAPPVHAPRARPGLAKAAASPRRVLLPEDHLLRAEAATTPAERARHARLGLASRCPLDRTTQAMLLRQLYMANFEQRRFRRALDLAEDALELSVMPDVLHQDAARAAVALRRIDRALGHLRLAARKAPAQRRAFHHWTLGCLLHLLGRYDEASGSLLRAARWGTTDKPLYKAHAVLARLSNGERPRGAKRAYSDLMDAPCGQGYGRFVLGQLAHKLGREDDAARHLDAFVRRTRSARPALEISLAGELAAADEMLQQLRRAG